MRRILVILIATLSVAACSSYIVKRPITDSAVVLINVEDFDDKIYNTYIGVMKWQNYQMAEDSSFSMNEFFEKNIINGFESKGHKVIILPAEWKDKISKIYITSSWDGSKTISNQGEAIIDELKKEFGGEVLIDIGASKKIINEGAYGPFPKQCGVYTDVNYRDFSHPYCERWAVAIDLKSNVFLGNVWSKAAIFHNDLGFIYPKEPTKQMVQLVEKDIMSEQLNFINAVIESSTTGQKPSEYQELFVQ